MIEGISHGRSIGVKGIQYNCAIIEIDVDRHCRRMPVVLLECYRDGYGRRLTEGAILYLHMRLCLFKCECAFVCLKCECAFVCINVRMRMDNNPNNY